MSRQRIDERMVEEGLAESRSQAQRVLMAGLVRLDGQLCDKASTLIRPDQMIVVERPPPFVSRGGEKLEHALEAFAQQLDAGGLDVAGARAIDLGASTGGFVDCLLQRGAAEVVAVDVGHGQLHPRLRADPRVHVMERTNARHLTPERLPYRAGLITCDASFIPLATILPAPLATLEPGWWGVLLCKPQFEAGRVRLGRHGRKGVLVDEGVRREVVDETVAAVRGLGVVVERIVQAHPPGPKGNVEYALLVRDGEAHGSGPLPVIRSRIQSHTGSRR